MPKKSSRETVEAAPASKRPEMNHAQPQAEAAPPKKPSHDEIAARAYAIFQSRPPESGDYIQDWLQAERELEKRA